MIWAYILCGLIMLMGIFFSVPAHSVETVKKEKGDYFNMEKIKFDGHSYIHFRNRFNSHDSHMFHDPECEKCLQDKGEKK